MNIKFTIQEAACIYLPASKSLSNRALLINALSNNSCTLHNLSNAEDTVAFTQMLQSTGLVLNANEAGTAMRFGTALFSVLNPGTLKIITGAPTLRKRPIADLVSALQSIGAQISYHDVQGELPISIKSAALAGGEVLINSGTSSQFVSALCMIAPVMQNGLHITLENEIVSEPYIKMTLGLMQYFGIQHQFVANKIIIAPQQYQAKAYTVEADWSSACFVYCFAILAKLKNVQLPHLNAESLQGDSYVASLAKDFGVSTQFSNEGVLLNYTGVMNISPHYNFNNCPDLAIPFIVTIALLSPSTTISGLSTLLHKESNRVAALQSELAKIGITIAYQNDCLSFSGTMHAPSQAFESWNDHRIAMALSLISVFYPIKIAQPNVVKKSFPNFWSQIPYFTIGE
jgi:3-phosphoshikimate 1-carboxyvinyltransferase